MSEQRTKLDKLTKFIFMVVVLLVFVQLIVSHRLATTGENIIFLEENANKLIETNHRLAEEINQMGSLTKIASRAHQLGLDKASQVLHLTPLSPVALGR